MPRTLLAVLALALCSLVSASAQAAFWLVPAGAQPPSVVAAALARAGVSADLVAVMAGLNAAFPIRNRARMVDLETGLVRELDAGALQGVSIEHDGRFLTLAELLTLPGAVIVLDVDAAQGPTVQVLESDGTVQTDVLEPDERALLGELPCGEGYAPVSMPSGMRCEDIDECEADLDDCDAHASCDNTDGSFECSCDDGYEGDGRDCEEASSTGGGDEPGGEGGAGAPDGGTADDAGGVQDGGGPVSDAGGSAPDAGRGGDDDPKDGGGGCDCQVAGFEASSLAHPLLLPLAWLLHRRRRSPRRC